MDNHRAMDDRCVAIYQRVRERVLSMLADEAMQAHPPSPYWADELSGLDYLLDATPAIIRTLRQHCHHLTGLRAYDYRRHHVHAADAFRAKLAALRKHDSANLFVPESPVLGGFGHDIDGSLVNLDTLKFYECLIAMKRGGLLDGLEQGAPRVLEIGAGWGGLAYQFKTLFARPTYVIVDLPHSLLVSATYLLTAFPDCKHYIYGDDGSPFADGSEAYDFVFLPHYAFWNYALPPMRLAINTVSFQEMTEEQVTAYLDRLHEIGCPKVYSLNRDRSPHNRALSKVDAILAKHYQTSEITVLPAQYTELTIPPRLSDFIPRAVHPRAVRQIARSAYRLILRRLTRDPFPYRHIVASQRPMA